MRHFCFSFDLHNYCPTCREAGKGDDPCVTFETPCDICTSFTDEQMKKIQHRKRYLKKQKAETSSKDNELDLLGKGDRDSFTGSNADLESAADNLYIVNVDLPPPRPSTKIQTEAMDVDYGPALPPRLVLDQHEPSDQYVAPSELPPKEVSYSDKKQSHSRSRQEIDSGSASDQLNEESDEPQIPSTKPKKHSDKSKHKSRSRYVSSSSGEDQSPVARQVL